MKDDTQATAGPGARRRAKRRVKKRKPRANASADLGLWAWAKQTYATVDPRSLGVFRILFALVLLHDVARRWPDLVHHYSNAGWLTNHFAMFRPMSDHLFSLYLAFSTPSEVYVFATFHLIVNLLLLIGWRTRLMQVLAFVLIVSLNSRNIMLENGGFVVVHLIALWTCFLPLGRRYSVDALLLSMKRRKLGTLEALNDDTEAPLRIAPVVALAVPVIILQFAIIYYFNVVHKTGPAWKDGTAVYYFFQQDRMVTALGAWLRFHVGLGFIKLLTWSTLVMESLIALFLVSPVYSKWLRMVGWSLVFALHFSIDAVVQLGPFSYAMFVIHSIFIPREFWEYWRRRTRARHGVRVVGVDTESGFSLWWAGLTKRLLPVQSVRFERSERKDAGQLVVRVEPQGSCFVGARALLALVEPSVPLRMLFLWLRLPVFQGWVDRLMGSALKRRQRLSSQWALDELVGDDQRADPPSRRAESFSFAAKAAGNVVLMFFVVSCTSQVLIENRAIPAWLKPEKRPEWMTAAVVYPRLFQGWSMFAPDPPRDDGKIVVEGRTKDGRRFDPLSQSVPNYELNPPEGFKMNQLWGDFHRRIWQQRFRSYWNGVRDYLRNHHKITNKPEDELVAFEVYYVSEVVPPPGQPRPAPRKERLFSWGNMRRFAGDTPKNTTR